MKAERAVTKISRDYRKFARNMAIMKNSMDRASDIYNARMEGKAEGLAEGEIKLTKRNYEIAKKALAKGLSIETIQEITGLTEDIIKEM